MVIAVRCTEILDFHFGKLHAIHKWVESSSQTKVHYCGSKMNIRLVIALLGLLASLASCALIKKSQCSSYGFNENTLQCSTCETLSKIVSNRDAYENCKVCCIEKVEDLFGLAVLEVDNRYLAHMADLDAIVAKKDELKLKVKYRFGSPVLKMYKASSDEEPAETIAVGTWNQDNFKEYLKSHLK